MRCWEYEMSGVWDVGSTRCCEHEMLGVWDFGSIKCWEYEMLGVRDVGIMRCREYEMLGVWDVESMRWWEYEMLAIGCVNERSVVCLEWPDKSGVCNTGLCAGPQYYPYTIYMLSLAVASSNDAALLSLPAGHIASPTCSEASTDPLRKYIIRTYVVEIEHSLRAGITHHLKSEQTNDIFTLQKNIFYYFYFVARLFVKSIILLTRILHHPMYIHNFSCKYHSNVVVIRCTC